MGGRKKPHLVFRKLPRLQGKKTDRWSMKNTPGDDLGIVRWKSSWRRYTAEFSYGCPFDEECLGELKAFLKKQTDKRKRQWKGR